MQNVPIQLLSYQVDRDKTGEHTLLSLTTTVDPDDRFTVDIEPFSSFGVTLPKDYEKARALYWPRPVPESIEEAIYIKLHSLLSQYWSYTWGYPVIQFDSPTKNWLVSGSTENIIFFLPPDLSPDKTAWINSYVPLIQRFGAIYFLAITDETNIFFTKSHTAAINWLSQKRGATVASMMSHQKYNFDKRMKDWYGIQVGELSAAAKGVLDEFTFIKKYSHFIPDYLVVPAYHITRYKKALRLIEEKHNPSFVMTLPLFYASKEYTILFPVLGEDK